MRGSIWQDRRSDNIYIVAHSSRDGTLVNLANGNVYSFVSLFGGDEQHFVKLADEISAIEYKGVTRKEL